MINDRRRTVVSAGVVISAAASVWLGGATSEMMSKLATAANSEQCVESLTTSSCDDTCPTWDCNKNHNESIIDDLF